MIVLSGWGSSGFTTFDVYRDGSLYSPANTGPTFSNYGPNVTAGTTYSYYVIAKNAYGQTQSNTITVTAPTSCGPTTGSLQVTVRRSDTNAPLSGASVSLSGGPSSPASQTTEPDGTTTFSNLGVGGYTVTASLTGFQTNSSSATVSANTTTPVMIPLTPVAVSIARTTPPPSAVTSETPFTVAWSISGGESHPCQCPLGPDKSRRSRQPFR